MRRKCPAGEVSEAKGQRRELKNDKRREHSYNFSMTWICDNLKKFSRCQFLAEASSFSGVRRSDVPCEWENGFLCNETNTAFINHLNQVFYSKPIDFEASVSQKCTSS